MTYNDFEKILLSGSSNGKPIALTGTDNSGASVIHTATNDAAKLDEVWIFATNVDTGINVGLTLYWVDTVGGADTDGNSLHVGIPYREGLVYVLQGFPLSGGRILKAYASVADKINVLGWVNRISRITSP